MGLMFVMIGLLFFGLLGLFFFGLTKFSQRFFKFLDKKIGFANFPIWKKVAIYVVYAMSIFMLLFGDEWLGRMQHPKMCEKYAYLKYDRDKLFNSELDKNSLRSNFNEFKPKYTFAPLMMHKLIYANPNTGEVYFEKTTVSRHEGWIARFTGFNFVSLIKPNEAFFNNISGDRCINIPFKGKYDWVTPPDISIRLEYLDIDDGIFLRYY